MKLQELIQVKQKGYALDIEENENGITCIGVPIFDHSGKVIAAVSISGPSIRMTDERLKQLKTRILQIGKQISARLGYGNRNSS